MAVLWMNTIQYSARSARLYLIGGFLGPPESQRKRHPDRFSRFCRAHWVLWQTDRRTDRQTCYSVGNNRRHLRTVKFLKLCSDSFYCDTDRRVVFKFREIWPTGNQWNLALFTEQKNSAASQTFATARMVPKICQGKLPTMHSECCRLYPNRFTFGGVVAERVNTAKTRRKVNPIFGWSLDRLRAEQWLCAHHYNVISYWKQ